MKYRYKISCFASSVLFSSIVFASEVPFTTNKVTIDGQGNEAAWAHDNWRKMDYHILGQYPDKEDFSARYKLLWDEDFLYILAEIQDDILFDQHSDPLYKYWDDDCLEIFVDEDASGGEHQMNFNAFAYHVALDNQVVDIGVPLKHRPENFILLNDHLKSRWRRSESAPYRIHWEVAMKIYDDSFQHPNVDNKHKPVKLTKGKTMGFMLAYCDNDGSEQREHFIGSKEIKPINGDKNLGYKTADVFEKITLIR